MSSTRTIKSLKRAFRTGLDDLLYLASVVVIVILVNAFLESERGMRVDLTEEGLYTLTPSTEDFVRDLPGKIEIKAFFSEGLQAPDHNLAQRVEDVLVEFEAASDGKLSYEIIFPDEDSEEDEELAKGYGIEKVAIGHRDKNQVGLRLVYKGIAFVYGDKQEVINDVQASDLEYEITKTLKNLVKTKDHKIGVLQGFGGPGGDPQFLASLQQAFESVYGGLILAEGVDLSTQDSIPSDIDALLILNVQEAVSEQAKMAIDQFLMQGKSVALFQSPSASDPRMQQLPFRMPIEHGLNELFEKYGVRLKQDLVLDREKNMVGLELTSQGIAEVSIPTLPMLTGINRENILTKNLDAMVLPFSGSLELTEDALNASELRVSKLIESAESAVSRPAMGDLKLESLMTPSEDEQAGPLLLAVSLDGVFESAYAESLPEGMSKPEGFKERSESGARILVVSNGEFMFANPRIGYGNEAARFGVLFFLNSMDWLVQDEALIRIRSKGVPRMLEPVDLKTQRWLQLANVVGIPFGVVMLGLIAWGLRVLRRMRIEDRFTGRKA